MTVPWLSISSTLDPVRRSSEAIRVLTHCRSIDVVTTAWTLASMACVG